MSKQTHGVERLTCRLDLDAVVFDGDRDLRRELNHDEVFRDVTEAADCSVHVASARRDLLRTALKLSPGIAADAFQAVERCRARLAFDAPVEMFCVPSPEINAFVTPPENGRVLLGITSAALEKLDADELTFVIGHELGHALFDHFAFEPEILATDERIAPSHVARLYAWLRYAELSADRVGLLCAESAQVAVRAFFKMTSGLSDARFMANAAEVAEQYKALAAEGVLSDEADWFSTHPYSPLRIRAMDLFARSQTFAALLGRDGGQLDEPALEQEVAGIMRLMDPSFLDDDSPCTQEIREFLALAGLEVAMADGDFAEAEAEALSDLAGDLLVEDPQFASLNEAQRAARLEELAQTLRIKLSGVERQKIIEDLVAVAAADLEIIDSEVALLQEAAMLLDVDPLFVDETIGRLLTSLD